MTEPGNEPVSVATGEIIPLAAAACKHNPFKVVSIAQRLALDSGVNNSEADVTIAISITPMFCLGDATFCVRNWCCRGKAEEVEGFSWCISLPLPKTKERVTAGREEEGTDIKRRREREKTRAELQNKEEGTA